MSSVYSDSSSLMAWSELPRTQNKRRNTVSDRALVIRRENLPIPWWVRERHRETEMETEGERERENSIFGVS